MTNEERSVKYLGTTDDVTTCDCCGRTELKSTVALSIDESDAVYYGVTCAAHALKRSVAEVKKGTAAADRAIAKARYEADAKVRKAEWDRRLLPWFTFLRATVPGFDHDEIFQRIQALGGHTKARELYKASTYYIEGT